MTLPDILLNVSYTAVLTALTVRDILWLRSILIFGQVLMIAYAVLQAIPTIAVWNAFFLAVNVFRVARILAERKPVRLPEDMTDIHREHFHSMAPRDFLYFWSTGKELHKRRGDTLIRKGARQDELLMFLRGGIVSGRGEVRRGDFVELGSYLTGQGAEAEAVVTEDSDFIAWNRKKLEQVGRLTPALMSGVNECLARMAVRKNRALRESLDGSRD